MTRKLLYASIFLSAALLFLIQPLYAKYLLPYFGGASSVWIISIFFYSTTLLLGYIYASLLTKWSLGTSRIVHGTLLVLTGALLIARWLSDGSAVVVVESSQQSAAISTLLTLLYGVGLPVLLLASTSVVVQHLFALHTKEDPYWLYTLSNAGSLIGLAIFPFLLEPLVNLPLQIEVWTIGFVLFLILLLTAWKRVEKSNLIETNQKPELPRPMVQPALILLYAAVPTFLLASMTDLFSRGIASFPMLWVIPLMLYLLTFVVAFRDRMPFSVLPLGPTALASGLLVLLPLTLMNKSLLNFFVAFGFGMLFFFLVSTFFHRTIYLMRPDSSQLGKFYIWLTFGGAIGSGSVGLLLPALLDSTIEVYVGLAVIVLYFIWTQMDILKKHVSIHFVHLAQAMFVLSVVLFTYYSINVPGLVDSKRNFFGSVRVTDENMLVNGEPIEARYMVHGTTLHGLESRDPEFEKYAVSYYGTGSGIELSLRSFVERNINPKVNVIGLGAGMMATFCDNLERLDYVEINPVVLELAQEHFSYLDRCTEKQSVTIGDGRLVLETLPPRDYDVIMVDAFSDDAIPAHLLTKEAFHNAYLPQLSDEGVLVIHITNRFLDLHGAVAGMVDGTEYQTIAVRSEKVDNNQMSMTTIWVILAKGEQAERILSYENTTLYQGPLIKWTDSKNSILQTLSSTGSR